MQLEKINPAFLILKYLNQSVVYFICPYFCGNSRLGLLKSKHCPLMTILQTELNRVYCTL